MHPLSKLLSLVKLEDMETEHLRDIVNVLYAELVTREEAYCVEDVGPDDLHTVSHVLREDCDQYPALSTSPVDQVINLTILLEEYMGKSDPNLGDGDEESTED